MAWMRTAAGVRSREVGRITELVVLGVIVIDFGRVVARVIGLDTPLIWDEAVYADRARAWLDPSASLSDWSYIRPPLLPVIETVAVAAGGDEWMLRITGLLAGAALIIGAWWLARSIAGPLAGLAAAGALHGSPTVQWHSGLALTDVPSAALLVTVAALLWRELELRDSPGPGVAWATMLASLAFFTRYGTVIAIALIILLATAVWWRKILAAPRWPLIALGIGVVAILGHVAWSIGQTGSPIGILRASQEIVPIWEGSLPFDRFQQWIKLELAGQAGEPVVVAGFIAVPIAAAVALFAPRWRRFVRAMVLVSTVGIGQIVMLVIGVPHVEQRYFVLAIALLIVAGACLGAQILSRMMAPVQLVAALAFGTFLLANRAPSVDLSFDRTLVVGRAYEPYRIVGEAIDVRAGRDCGVVGGGGWPIVSWYSGCEVLAIPVPVPPPGPGNALAADDRWLLTFGTGDRRAEPFRTALTYVDGPAQAIRDPQTGRLVATIWPLAR